MYPLERRPAAVFDPAACRAEQLELVRVEGIEAGDEQVREAAAMVDEDPLA
jgi:hypothetical protein